MILAINFSCSRLHKKGSRMAQRSVSSTTPWLPTWMCLRCAGSGAGAGAGTAGGTMVLSSLTTVSELLHLTFFHGFFFLQWGVLQGVLE